MGYLGQPLETRQKHSEGYYTRQFENGLVIFNPTQSSHSVPLPQSYHKILGWITPENDGQLVSETFAIPKQDGRILIKRRTVGIKTETGVSALFESYAIQPNPFNPVTTIKFSLKNESEVSIKIFDLKGQAVVNLLNNEKIGAGNCRIVWKAGGLPSGIYLVRLSTDKEVLINRVILLK